MLLFNHSVVSDFYNPLDCSTPCFLVLHGLPEFAQIQWALNQWCHATISFSVASFSSCPQSFPASGSFPNESALCIRWPKYYSFSFSISPFREFQDWFPIGLIGLISLLSKGLSRVFSSTTVHKHQFMGSQSSWCSNSHIHPWPLEEP